MSADLKSKICRGCNEELPLVDFGPCSSGADGRNARCRKCVAAYMREYHRKKQLAKGIVVAPRCTVPNGRPSGHPLSHDEAIEYLKIATSILDGLCSGSDRCIGANVRAGQKFVERERKARRYAG